MDTTIATATSNDVSPAATLQLHSIIPEIPDVAMELPSFLSLKRQCLGNSAPGEFFLASCPSIALHVLTTCDLDPRDLAKLEASDDALSCFHFGWLISRGLPERCQGPEIFY